MFYESTAKLPEFQSICPSQDNSRHTRHPVGEKLSAGRQFHTMGNPKSSTEFNSLIQNVLSLCLKYFYLSTTEKSFLTYLRNASNRKYLLQVHLQSYNTAFCLVELFILTIQKKRFLLFDIIYLCLSSGGFNRGALPLSPAKDQISFTLVFSDFFFSNVFRFIFVMYVIGVPPPRNPTSAPTNFFLSTKTFKKSLLKSY